jgi:hypothetical protein
MMVATSPTMMAITDTTAESRIHTQLSMVGIQEQDVNDCAVTPLFPKHGKQRSMGACHAQHSTRA